MKFSNGEHTGEYIEVNFKAGLIAKGDPYTCFIDILPQGEKLEILDGGILSLWPRDGVSFQEIEELAAKLRDSIKHIQYDK